MIKLVSQSFVLVVLLSSGSSWGSQDESKKSATRSPLVTRAGLLHRLVPTSLRQPLSLIRRLFRPGSGHGPLVEASSSKGGVDQEPKRATTNQMSHRADAEVAKHAPEVGRRVLALQEVARKISQGSDGFAADSFALETPPKALIPPQEALNDASTALVQAISCELSVPRFLKSDALAAKSLWVAHERVCEATLGAMGIAIDHRLKLYEIGMVLQYLVAPLSIAGNLGRRTLEERFVVPLGQLVERVQTSRPAGYPESPEVVEHERYLKSLKNLEQEARRFLPEPERPPR